jgi:hypothetical protein
VGPGETFMGAAALEAYLHETVAPKPVGRAALAIDGTHAARGEAATQNGGHQPAVPRSP